MAGGLGLLFSGLAGGSKGLATGMEDERQTAERASLETLRSNLEEQKALRIAEASRVATRQAGIQQGKDIDSATVQLQNERDASAINAANAGVEGGSNMTAADAAVLRDKPEARKAYGLLNPNRQSDLEDRATAAEKLGYLDAARETRGALQTEIADQRYDQQSKDTNRRLDISEANAKAQQEFNNKMEARRLSVAEADIAYRKSRDVSLDAKATQAAENAQRAATVEAMKNVSKEAKETQLQLADPMKSDEEKAILKGNLETLRLEERRFRNALASVGIEGSESPSKPFNPADFRTSKPSESAAPKAGGVTVPNPVQAPAPAAAKEPEKRPRSAAEIRGAIEKRETFVSRGKTKTQYKNQKTGEWVDSIAEATKDL